MSADNDRTVAVLQRYFDALDASDFEIAAEQFAKDVTYLHPPMYGDETRIDGRDALREFFVETRGETDSLHHVDRWLEGADGVSAVGHVTPRDGDERLDTFVSYAEVVDGKITYYAAGLVG